MTVEFLHYIGRAMRHGLERFFDIGKGVLYTLAFHILDT